MREDWLAHIKAMSPEDQYKYFLNRVAEFEVLWGLYDEKNKGWAMTLSDENKERLALWPEPEMARLNAQDTWKKYRAETLDLYGFIEHGIEELEEANRGVSLMYLPDYGGLEVDLPYLERDLREAIHMADDEAPAHE